ncbi:MAG TPA: anti-sigma factor [Steroidobacteraceae bacterium]|nr:anti-sigma factor [Steroidobacteraceae bacterium]
MECAEGLRVQAYFDGEVDALAAQEIERHVEICAGCRTLLQELGQVRRLIRNTGLERAPAALRERLRGALDREAGIRTAPRTGWLARLRSFRTFWVGLVSGAGAAMAATFVTVFVLALPSKPLLDDLVADHTRSLLASHLVDVVSSDRHTVRPWFSGRTDVSPVVVDLAPQGYRLLGGRAEFLDHQRAAVLVYQHGAHVINVFSWALRSGELPRNTTRNGYHLVFWKVGNVGYCGISDAGWGELQVLQRLLQSAAARDAPE